eukprot:4107334-Pleurochrysis_carterae.AAC.1
MHGAGAGDSARQHTAQARPPSESTRRRRSEQQRTAQVKDSAKGRRQSSTPALQEWTAQGARRRECQREWAGRR